MHPITVWHCTFSNISLHCGSETHKIWTYHKGKPEPNSPLRHCDTHCDARRRCIHISRTVRHRMYTYRTTRLRHHGNSMRELAHRDAVIVSSLSVSCLIILFSVFGVYKVIFISFSFISRSLALSVCFDFAKEKLTYECTMNCGALRMSQQFGIGDVLCKVFSRNSYQTKWYNIIPNCLVGVEKWNGKGRLI